MYRLKDTISSVKYIGLSRSELLQQKGINTIQDLVNVFPRSYRDTRSILNIEKLYEKLTQLFFINQFNSNYTVRCKLKEVKTVRTRNGRIISTAIFEQNDKRVKAMWFNYSFVIKSLRIGEEYLIYGKYLIKGTELTTFHPIVESINKSLKKLGNITPVYPKVNGLSGNYIGMYIREVFKEIDRIPEYIPRDILEQYNIDDIEEAYLTIHKPDEIAPIEFACERLILQELLEDIANWEKKVVRKENPLNKCALEQMISKYTSILPFKMTKTQKVAVNAIVSSFNEKYTNDVFLYGDVGSGKTAIVFVIALSLLSFGYSTAIMVPTTILAQQHYDTLLKLFASSIDANSIKLIVSKTKIEKSSIPSIFIGTQALISRSILNKETISLIVVDEQHRFGVVQRMEEYSDLNKIILSATPIPRTLAKVLIGSSKYIEIEDRKNTKKITTKFVPESRLQKMYKWIGDKLKNSDEQAYIVFPRIQSGDESVDDLLGAVDELQRTYFNNISTAVLHGKLSEKRKNEIMSNFSVGKIRVLLSTNLIEVGIDVPKATIMVIHSADMFGLAQLHQLRGRVGRGVKESWCFITTNSFQKEVIERLDFFTKTTVGKDLAKYDLYNRGVGNIWGLEQSGQTKYKIANQMHFNSIKKALDIYKSLKDKKVKIVRYFNGN